MVPSLDFKKVSVGGLFGGVALLITNDFDA
jgi:hypothetical protein